MKDLVIIGAGGFARETAWAADNVIGFLDDNPAIHGEKRAGYPVLGGLELVAELPDAMFVICAGSPRDYGVRERLAARLGLPVERYATVIHSSVHIGHGCTVGPGSVLLPGVSLTVDVTVGAHVAVMPQVVLTHDDMIGDYATIASGARLGGGVRIEHGAYIGAGALIRESVRIGAGSLVGLGSVVLRDIPANQVWAGNPARYLREAS